MNNKAPIVSFHNVTKRFVQKGSLFGKKKYLNAVRNVTFDIYKGEVMAVVGESGCGKTTMARMLTKLYEPSSGNIIVDGIDITTIKSGENLKHLRRKVQMIFQDPFASLNPAHRVAHIIGRAIEMYNPGFNKMQVRQKIIEILESVGLTPAYDFMEKYPSQLSGGQRQRIVIARALAVEPSIIVADEPTSMLDVSIGIDIMNLMLDLKNQMHLTYMYITHNLASARYMADKIIVMYAGNCVEFGNVDEVVKNPLHPYTVLLLSSTPEPFREKRLNISANEELPDLTDDSPRCLFYNRCPKAAPKCMHSEPPTIEFADGRRVKCFLYEGIKDSSKSFINALDYVNTK